jgi:hypothetical protein
VRSGGDARCWRSVPVDPIAAGGECAALRVGWARKDAYDFGYLDDVGHNCWQMSRQGRQRYVELKEQFSRRQIDVRRCYMWRESLKRHMLPDYTFSPVDAQRPHTIYRDELHHSRFQDILRFL